MGMFGNKMDAYVDDAPRVDDTSIASKVVGWMLTAIIAAIILVVLWPVVLVSLGLYFLGRHLAWNKMVWSAMLGASTLAILLTWKESTVYYFTWVLQMYPVDLLSNIPSQVFNDPPNVGMLPLPLLTLSAFWTSIFCLLQDTRAGEFIGRLLRRQRSELNLWKSILPSTRDRKNLTAEFRKRKPPYEEIPGNELSEIPQPAIGKGVGPVGRDGKRKNILLSSDALKTHAVILGSTGSGKTVFLKSLIGMLLDFGYDGTMVDLKEDTAPGELRDFCRAYAWHNDLNYQEVSLGDPGGGSWFLNALDGMNADEAFNAIMATQTFDDQYHQAMNRKMAAAAVQLAYALYEADKERFGQPSLYTVGQILSNPENQMDNINTAKRAGRLSADDVMDRFGALIKPDKDLTSESKSFGTKLLNLYNSSAGRDVLRPGETPWGQPRAQLDLSEGGLTYIGLSSLSKRDHAEALSAGILQRFSVMAANRSAGLEEKTERFLMIDEASVIDRDMAINLLNKCRGANIRVVLATQGPDDWNTGESEDWERITQNHNVSIFMRMPSVKAAELASEFIGQGEYVSLAHTMKDGKLTGETKTSESEKAHVLPEEFRSLEAGEFILRVGAPHQLTWGYGFQRKLEEEPYMNADRPIPLPGKKWMKREDLLKYVSESDLRAQEEASKEENTAVSEPSAAFPTSAPPKKKEETAGSPPPKKKS